MEQVCVVIAGKMNNMMFQKAKAAAEVRGVASFVLVLIIDKYL